MPHDRKGNLLNVGDQVHVPCVVKEIQAGDEFYNLTLETIEPMYPGDQKSAIALNAGQVEKST
jgi:hypothetical protein